MPPYIHPEVERVRDNPTRGDTIKIVLVTEEGALPEVVAQIRKMDEMLLERQFERDMLLIKSPETKISRLCKLDSIESISPNEQMELLA